MKTFRQWLQEMVGPVIDDPNNANMAFGIKGVNSKYHAREAPNGPSTFDPDELFLGVPDEEEDGDEEDEEKGDEQEIPAEKRKVVP